MPCSFSGQSEFYGLGIRVSFYLLWLGLVAASWLTPDAVPLVRQIQLLFVVAGLLGLVVAAAQPDIRPVELYLVLQLAYGCVYVLLPLYLWRFITGCSPIWDPARWPRSRVPGRAWSLGLVVTQLTATGLFLWFWSGVQRMESGLDETNECVGFFFGPVSLDNSVFVGLHLVLGVVILVCLAAHLVVAVGMVRPPRCLRKQIRRARKRGISYERRGALHFLLGIFRVTTASLVIAAVELTIRWNGITNVSTVSSLGQMVPLVVAVGVSVPVFWTCLTPVDEDASDTTSSVESLVEGIHLVV